MSDSLTSATTVNAICLFVDDLERSRDFYARVFDRPVVFEDDTSVCLKFDGLVVNLLASSVGRVQVEPSPVPGPETGCRVQLSVWVDDVDAVARQLADLGVHLSNGPADRPWGMRSLAFLDPDGHSWEIAQELNG